MGTYIYYQQRDPALFERTNEILHQVTTGQGDLLLHVGGVDPGTIKISGGHVEDAKLRKAVVSALASARKECGLHIDLPTGVEHYLPPEDLESLLPAAERQAQQAAKDAAEATYQENLRSAKEKLASELSGLGKFTSRTATGDPIHLYFGKTTSPEVVKVEAEYPGYGVISKPYRNQQKAFYMAIPLMPTNKGGQDAVRGFLEDAHSMGWITHDPMVIMISCYRNLPSTPIVFQGNTYQAKDWENPSSLYGSVSQARILADGTEAVEVAEIEPRGMSVASLEPVKGRGQRLFATYPELAKIVNKMIEDATPGDCPLDDEPMGPR